MSTGNVPTFNRTNVWDPYKRLGVSPYASEEEIWGSRNFLLQQYAGHERSEESIEAAFEKLLMTSFKQRKKTKINLKSRLKKKVEESPPWIQNLLNFVELPPMDIIFRRLFLFAFMGGWSIMNSAEGGPAFQVCFTPWLCSYLYILLLLKVCSYLYVANSVVLKLSHSSAYREVITCQCSHDLNDLLDMLPC